MVKNSRKILIIPMSGECKNHDDDDVINKRAHLITIKYTFAVAIQKLGKNKPAEAVKHISDKILYKILENSPETYFSLQTFGIRDFQT